MLFNFLVASNLDVVLPLDNNITPLFHGLSADMQATLGRKPAMVLDPLGVTRVRKRRVSKPHNPPKRRHPVLAAK